MVEKGKKHNVREGIAPQGLPRILLIGNPNVGKSVIFNALTGLYVTVSNYPGTTVEVSRGEMKLGDGRVLVIDTPGIYSMVPITEEERVTRRLLLEAWPDVVVHVTDAKNLARMLPLTFELLEANLPVILCVNMLDEASRAGISIDGGALERALGIPVVLTSSVRGEGIPELINQISQQLERGSGGPASGTSGPKATGEAGGRSLVNYGEVIEGAIRQIEGNLTQDYPIGKRSLALLLLSDDEEAWEFLRRDGGQGTGERLQRIRKAADEARGKLSGPVALEIAVRRRRAAEELAKSATSQIHTRRVRGLVDRLTLDPITGIPILVLVVYLGLVKFVGGFGAGVLVDFLEGTVFERYINPAAMKFASTYIRIPALVSLVAGDYGIITLAIRYAVAIILPIVGAFFLVFSILEDCGYLPRLAMLLDRAFKSIGLSGRAIIPMVLGFGCGTMATIVTRTLETRRERIIATFLLALAIPCSAQLGVILGILGGHPSAMVGWAAFVGLIFVLSGYLAKRILPGDAPSFYMELPPLRVPQIGNILAKTWARMRWYFIEVIPIFVLASVIIWLGDLTGLLDLGLRALTPAMHALGLPDAAGKAFLFGFFRRDYGAAGLFDLHSAGLLSVRQMTVAAITLTLFIPCIAQFSVMVKERGILVAAAMAIIIFPLAFVSGYLVNLFFGILGVGL